MRAIKGKRQHNIAFFEIHLGLCVGRWFKVTCISSAKKDWKGRAARTACGSRNEFVVDDILMVRTTKMRTPIFGAGRSAASAINHMRSRRFLPTLLALMLISFWLSPLVNSGESAGGSPAKEKADLQKSRLQFFNGTEQPVDIFWLKADHERVLTFKIAPGENKITSTEMGHRFVAVDSSGKDVGTVTCEVRVQAYRVGGVPAFYTQQTNVHGFPITASKNVNPYALKEAAYLFELMLSKRPDVREAMIKSGARLCIRAWNEFTSEQPEWQWLSKRPEKDFPDIPARDYWAARARGMGGSESDPYCSCAEENLLCYPGDQYSTENILIREFAHNIHLRGMVNVDPASSIHPRYACSPN